MTLALLARRRGTVGGGISVSASTSSSNVVQGSTTTVTFTLTRNGAFTGTVTPTDAGLPAGVSASFSPTTFGAGVTSMTMTLTATGGATPITNDAYTVTLAGSGVSSVVYNGAVTVTAAAGEGSTVTISTSDALMAETYNYANDAAFFAQVRDLTPPSGDPLSQATGGDSARYNDCVLPSLLELDAATTYRGHKTLKLNQPVTAGRAGDSPKLAAPLRPTLNGSTTTVNEGIFYFAHRYSAGWTDVGTDPVGDANAYKIAFIGWGNADGRLGLEWTNTGQITYQLIWSNNGSGNVSANGAGYEGSFDPPFDYAAAWANGTIIHAIMDLRRSSSTVLVADLYLWLDGQAKPSTPTATRTNSVSTGVLPIINRVNPGENKNKSTATAQYVRWLEWYFWDRATNSNPVTTTV